MKTRALIIIGLLILCFITPAFADSTDYIDKVFSEDRAVSVHFEKVVETSTSPVFSPFNYPSDQYKFYAVYYSLYNPSDSPVGYQFNISLKDQANNYFTSADEFTTPETVPAKGSLLNRRKDFAVYNNATNVWIVWTDKQPNPPWNHYDTVLNVSFASPTPVPVTPTATVSSSPTTAPTTAPGGNCLPFLPLGLLLTVVGGIGLLSMKYRNGR